MNGNMCAADRAALPAVARLYADNILNEPAIPPLLRDMADEVERLRLTADERETLECEVELAKYQQRHDLVALLRGLLERTK